MPLKPSVQIDLCIAAAALLLLRLIEPAYLIPDSYEIATIGECLWLQNAQWLDCSEASLGFRPIAPSILMGPLLFLTNSLNALGILCSLSLLLFFYSIQRIFSQRHLSICILFALLALPTTRQLMAVIDARIIVLGPLLWAYFQLISKPIKNLTHLWIGLAVSVAALSRPEQLLSVVIVLFWFRGLQWPAIAARFVGAMAPMAAWVAYLSHTAQQFVLSPRHWEGWILQQSELPLRWNQQLYGMGIWSPPLRELAVSFPAPPKPTVGLSVWAGLQWLGTSVLTPSALCLLFGAAIGFFVTLQMRKNKAPFALLIAFMLPNLVASVYPQARDPLFVNSNLIPPILGITMLGLLGYHQIFERVSLKPLRNILIPTIIVVLFTLSPTNEDLPQLHKTEAGQSFVLAYKDGPPSKTLASFETAPLLYDTAQYWQQLPSPFEERPEAEYLVYSHLDSQILLPQPQLLGKTAHLEEVFVGQKDESWVIIYRLEDISH